MVAPPNQPSLLEVSFRYDVTGGSTQLIRTRWVAGGLVLLATAICAHLLKLPLPELPLYATGLAVLAYNGAFVWASRRAYTPDVAALLKRTRWIVAAQVTLDWLALAAFVHWTGGVTSPAIPFLLVHLLIVSIVLPRWLPYLYVGLGMALLAAIAFLEGAGILPHYTVIPGLPADLHTNPVWIAGVLGFTLVAAAGIASLTVNIMAQLRQREDRINALFATTQAVTSATNITALLDRMARTVAEALGARGAAIHLLDETSDALTVAAVYGLSQSYLARNSLELSRGAVDGELMAGLPVVVHDIASDPRIRHARQVADEGLRSLLAVPVIGRSKPLGILCVYSDQPDRFTLADADFLMAIGRQSANALENALVFESLQQAEQARAEFVQVVTHELRAPVAGSQTLLRTMMRGLAGELNEQQRDLLSRIEHRLDMLMELVNDLLALAASKTLDVEEELKRQPLQPVLRHIVDRVSREAEAKGVQLQLDLPFEVLSVRATEVGLTRIFDNLIGNAIKYTPSGGRVCVRVVERPAGVVITVSDTGIGIPEEDIPRLFEGFFRARNAKESGIIGTGLGLNIVKQIVDRFGGMISVSSVLGQGTTFKVTLQRASPADEADEAA